MLKKKEKLEQMRELGRGSFSKGLSFLRSAAASQGMLEGGDAAPDGDGDAPAANGDEPAAAPSAEAPSGAAAGGGAARLSYEELVALSMKLTRQNKMMKAQFQKMQARMAALAVKEADCTVLSAFVADVVGVDLAACHVLEDKAGGDEEQERAELPRSTYDATQLRERYDIIVALRDKEKQTASTSEVVTADLLALSPVATTVTANAGAAYDEVDLLGNGESSQSDERVVILERQLEEATQQLAVMQQQVRAGAAESTALHEKYDTLWTQRSEQLDTVSREKEELVERIAELEKRWAKQFDAVSREKEELAGRVAELEQQTQQGDEEQRWTNDRVQLEEQLNQATAQAKELESEISEMRGQLEQKMSQTLQLETTVQQLNEEKQEASYAMHDKVQALTSELETTTAQLGDARQELEAALTKLSDIPVEPSQSADESPQQEGDDAGKDHELVDKLRSEIEELRALLASVRMENESLTAQVAAQETSTPSEPDSASASAAAAAASSSSQDEAAAADEANREMITLLQAELDRVKLARAEDTHSIRQLKDQVQKTEGMLEQAQTNLTQSQSLVSTLEADMQHLVAQVAEAKQQQDASDDRRSELEEQVQLLMESKEALHEELAILRRDTQSNLDKTLADAEQQTKQMTEERGYLTSKLEGLIKELEVVGKKNEELETTVGDKEKQVEKMAASQAAMTSEMMDLQKQIAAMREDLTMAAEGLEAHALKAEQNGQQREAAEKQLEALQLEMDLLRDSHHNDFEMLRQEKDSELERLRHERVAAVTTSEEREQARVIFEKRCETLAAELEGSKRRIAELEARVSQQANEVGNLSVDLAETKKALSDRMALAARLQTENMGIAGKQAEQAALIESALREAASSREQQRELEAELSRARSAKKASDADVAKTQRDIAALRQEVEQHKQQLDADLQTAKAKLNEQLAATRAECARDVERVEAESKHKSKLARQVVQEKEAEIAKLTQRVRALDEDVRSGEADNRKIFEFAQLQASREAEVRAQESQLREASDQIEALRLELEELRTDKQQQAQELTALMQTQRRDGVNMEYLKNVVVQYMSFRPGSSQQSRLVPVLTTLLQFTAHDINEIKRAAANRRSTWASWGVGSSSSGAIDKPIAVAGDNRHTLAQNMSEAVAEQDEDEQTGSGTSSRAASFNLPSSDPSALLPHASRESADF